MNTLANLDTTAHNYEELPKGIKICTNSKGETKYMIKVYGGINPKTGKSTTITRRGFDSLNQAKMALRRIEFAKKNGQEMPQKPKRLRFKEVYELWLPTYVVQKSTRSKTLGLFKNHILPAFGDCYIDKITFMDCTKFVAEIAQKLKNFSLTKYYASKIFNFATKLKLIHDNPLSEVATPQIVKEQKVSFETLRQRKYYTRGELTELLDSFKYEGNYMHYTFFSLLASTGMRKGEALALTWEDIDFDKAELNLNKAVGATGTELYEKSPKNGFARLIYLDDETVEVLRKWKKAQQKELLFKNIYPNKNEQLIFQNSHNQYIAPTKTTDWLNKIKRNYDVVQHLTTHHLRHTFATHMYANGVDIETIRISLGHKLAESTRKYIHQDSSVMKDAVKKLNEYRKAS